MQAAYLILVGRLLGLEWGLMSRFDSAGGDAAFLYGTTFRSNFLCNLGYGDAKGVRERLPRLSFDDVACII